MNALINWIVIPCIAIAIIVFHYYAQKKYLEAVRRKVKKWGEKKELQLDFEKTEFKFSDAYKRWVLVYGTDANGVQRKYTLKATGFWAYSLRREIKIIKSESI